MSSWGAPGGATYSCTTEPASCSPYLFPLALCVMEGTPLWFSMTCSVLLPWAASILKSKLLLISSVQCALCSALSITPGQDSFLQQGKEEPSKIISRSLSVFGVAMIWRTWSFFFLSSAMARFKFSIKAYFYGTYGHVFQRNWEFRGEFKSHPWTSVVVQWLRLWASTARRSGWIY